MSNIKVAVIVALLHVFVFGIVYVSTKVWGEPE